MEDMKKRETSEVKGSVSVSHHTGADVHESASDGESEVQGVV